LITIIVSEVEQSDSRTSIKLVESGNSDTDKVEELDRNSNVKRASDINNGIDNKVDDDEASGNYLFNI